MTQGFVYFLENESMPGLVKIGHSINHPCVRAAQLSQSTSCPTPFKVLAYFGSHDAAYAEKCIHTELDHFRVNDRREFFDAPYLELQDAMRRWGSSTDDAYFCAELDYRIEDEQKQRAA